jgi:hypothetical protein
MEADRMARIRDAVRMGYVENLTIDEIVRRIRGTRAWATRTACSRSTDGPGGGGETAIGHMAGFTRDRFMARMPT